MKHIKLFIAALVVFAGLGAVLVPGTTLAANPKPAATPKSSVCNALGSGSDCSKSSDNGVSLTTVVKVAINLLSFVVGVASVIMIIIGGLRYITSGGDSNNITSAKNTILYAIVGLVVVAMAQFIVQFVLGKIA